MIARVFPRRTSASPTDSLSYFGPPDIFALVKGITEVHVSVTFTWDIPKAEWLAESWSRIAPVKIGGPAFGLSSGDFKSGLYMREGYTITSRGCNNKCWFCKVWKREKEFKELPIVDGYIVQDDNLLSCSDTHIKSVFSMLKRQKEKADLRGCLHSLRGNGGSG